MVMSLWPRFLADPVGLLLFADIILIVCFEFKQTNNNIQSKFAGHSYRERKCADTVATALVPLAGHFQR